MRYLANLLGVFLLLALLALGARVLIPAITGDPAKWKMLLEPFELATKIAVFIAGAIFLLYKSFSGFYLVNMAITVSAERSASSATGTDTLGVLVTLTKGAQGSVVLEEGYARVHFNGAPQKVIPLVGISRLESASLAEVSWVRDPRRPELYLSPGESAIFAAVVSVPSTQACIVEVAVPGRRFRVSKKGQSQWRAATVALPRAKQHESVA